MKLWIAKNSEVSVREQILTQIRLGIASGDLLPGQKLPSTRELARRFSIHANTVSAAFQALSAEGLLTLKKGSGVFVSYPGGSNDLRDIDDRLMGFVSEASAAGITKDQIRSAMNRWLTKQSGSQILVIESDLRLREIILEELKVCTSDAAVSAVSYEEFISSTWANDEVIAALFDEKDKLMPHVPPGRKAVFLKVNSVPSSLTGSGKPSDNELIAVVSGWDQFIAYARVYLLAARIDPAALILRLTTEPEWIAGLDAASLIICDSFTSTRFQNDPRIRTFRLLKEESITELKNATV